MMLRLTFAASVALATAPALAQDHAGHAGHAGHEEHAAHSENPQPQDHAGHEGHVIPNQPANQAGHEGHSDHADHPAHTQEQDPHAGHAMDAIPMTDHSAHAVGEVPAGPPPPEAFDGPRHAADLIFGAARMAAARAENHATHGDMATGTLMVERLEARVAKGEDAFLWDLQGWYGGDIDKFVLKSEGEGELGGSVEDAEIQALWGHAIGPFFDLQAGARVDLEPETRSHLVLGVQGLAPYMWHVDAAAFLSDRGDLTARIEGEYDWKLTQRLILQPRAEVALSAQAIPQRELGSGITKVETGLRLRYEIAREFAPYIGVDYEAKLGGTADIAKAAGEDPDGLAILFGLRAWF